MSDLVTLDRKNPDFHRYLWGTFSKTERALPLKSLNVRTDRETVTFRIVPLAQVPRPSWAMVWLKALRPRSFLQVLMPMAVLLCLNTERSRGIDPDTSWIATLAVLLLHAAVLLRNDVEDHVSGADRVRTDRGSRAIQKGWLTATNVQRASFVFLALSFLCAIPLLIAFPSLIAVAFATILFGGLAFFRPGGSFKDLPAGELLIFLLGGPLLAVGYELALGGVVDERVLELGALWGWWLLFPILLRDLENLIAEGQAGRGSLLARLGFDRGLRLIKIWWFLGVVFFIAYEARWDGSTALWVLLLVFVLVSAGFIRRLRNLSSPAGSAVALVRRQGDVFFHLLVLIWLAESLWHLRL